MYSICNFFGIEVPNAPIRRQIDILDIDTAALQQRQSSSSLRCFERTSDSIPGVPVQEFLIITELKFKKKCSQKSFGLGPSNLFRSACSRERVG